jgi:hypothetical protein
LKTLSWLIAALALTAHQTASAIILDCKHNPDGTYTCVEIGKPSGADTASAAIGETTATDRAYIEQAKQQCSYRKPRTRAGGKGPTSALKMEAMKSAQADYERCLASTAAELKNSQQGD